MDDFLAAVGVQAMRYAIRSGIALTSSYAIGQCSRLLKAVDDKGLYSELRTLQKLLDGKIKVISPAIDLVEFKSGQGNVFLESALPLAKSLHQQIVSLGRRVEAAAAVEEHGHRSGPSPPNTAASHEALQKVIQDLKNLLAEIDRDIPLLQLAISASGESLSTSLPAGISPSRLLQASTLLIVGDTQFAQDPRKSVQIGPSFTLSIYMLFLGHASVSSAPYDPKMQPGAGSNHHQALSESADAKARVQRPAYGLGEHDRKPLWQEAIHKARVRLCRSACTPAIEGSPFDGNNCSNVGPDGPVRYAYHLEVVEDLDDGRAHEGDVSSQPFNGVSKAGIRELIPIHQLSKIFYTDTGRILNMGDGTEGENNPVLLLKRDINAPRQRRPEYDTFGEMDGAGSGQTREETNEYQQADVDRQLFGESNGPENLKDSCATALPKHLDPEWIAFEVFEEDDEQSDASSNADPDTESSDETGESEKSPAKSPSRPRAAMDSSLVSQIKNLSVQPSSHSCLAPSESDSKLDRPSQDLTKDSARDAQDFVSRSPFGAITTSLSLIEMLIRLAGLQEFQQASHLSIPDHILAFFLEETSTTGLTGEAMWKARSETKRHVGFDPYTDTA
ncbi:Ran-specific GTPase-activating protein 30 [Trichoderma ghanense]|uniref:Ran-specific GTPase-activating protein 30 n=1 Tax=Trichoderma ghanense TaxID=65468 RepID=A0ABY2HEK5_9HYPO